MLPQLAINIIRKDWAEYWKTVILLTAGMFLPLLVITGSKDFSQGLMAGIIISGSYGYAHFCFMTERLRGTLQLLLSLPVRPFNLVLAKFASLYSMALFTANVPGIFMRDTRLLFLLNALVLILSTVCMAATVVSEKPCPAGVQCFAIASLSAPSTQRVWASQSSSTSGELYS